METRKELYKARQEPSHDRRSELSGEHYRTMCRPSTARSSRTGSEGRDEQQDQRVSHGATGAGGVPTHLVRVL